MYIIHWVGSFYTFLHSWCYIYICLHYLQLVHLNNWTGFLLLCVYKSIGVFPGTCTSISIEDIYRVFIQKCNYIDWGKLLCWVIRPVWSFWRLVVGFSVASWLTMSDHKKMIVLILVFVTVGPLDRLDELDGVLQTVIRLSAYSCKGGDEGKRLLVRLDLEGLGVVRLDGLVVSLVKGDLSLVPVSALQGKIVVVIIVEICEGFQQFWIIILCNNTITVT